MDDKLLIEVIRSQQETIRALQEYIQKLTTSKTIEEHNVVQIPETKIAEVVEVSVLQNESSNNEPKVLGEWLFYDRGTYESNVTFKCSACGKYIPHNLQREIPSECPFCGTPMKKEYRCVEWYDFGEKEIDSKFQKKHRRWHPVLNKELDLEDEPAWIEEDTYMLDGCTIGERYAKCNKCGHKIHMTLEMWKDVSLLPRKCPNCGVEIHKSHFWTTWIRTRYPFCHDFWAFSGARCLACGADAPQIKVNGFNVGVLTSRCPSCGKHMTNDRCTMADGRVVDKTLKEEFEWRMLENE